ncbi:glutamine amidotransferase-like class 1 domain-containing protein 3, mitochondrial isoform X2 [Pituophis catenifer annectens]|uniref:glutamine amidotransferase-like class 1 domain-containing protein 3, mitochondrial isoform X2 n=1 Tax=Pituophis catenifer annectens TaxID=94852 RepID=UPI0039953595
MWAAKFANTRSPLLSSVLLLSKGAPASSSPFHSSAHRHRAKVAVVLSGCGVYDGTEIHEASAIMVHLSRGGANVDMYAPNISQMHVVDHSRGQPVDKESRNVLTESARIARGKIIDLARLTARDYDAVVFPGGFGAAKNLLCCISPVLAAKVLPGTEVTVGQEQEQGGKWPHASTVGAIKAMGGKHCAKDVTEAHVDNTNKIVTTPAFMCDTEFHHIFDGIGAMIKNLLRLTGK